MLRRFLMVLAATATVTAATEAKVRLSHLIGDNMILQQQTEARLWGWAQKGKTVKVTVSWSDAVYTTKADRQGRWLVKVQTPAASYTPLSITFDDGEPLTVSNVLAGEVWVCAGQSNMEMPLKGFGNCPVEGYNDAVIDARNHRAVHFCKVPSVMAAEPQDDAQCQWCEVDIESVRDASAIGYFFGRLVHSSLDIPVGLIEANKGGSRVESWLTKENLEKYTDDPTDSATIARRWPWDYHRSLLWGNGTFNPILNYTVKGILYYQGCSNVGDPGNQYSERLALLVRQWREQFGLGEIPFYFVEIAPYWYDDSDGTAGALLREQQFRALTLIPNSDLVCTNDLAYPYEPRQIHPCQKRQVGERLAYIALHKDYGISGVLCESPRYKDMKISGDTVFVHLSDELGGISRLDDIVGFELAGDDRVFHPATAEHFWQPGGGEWDDCIRLRSAEVRKPVAIRYCFRNFQLGNLKNAAGLPLFPFRTDSW